MNPNSNEAAKEEIGRRCAVDSDTLRRWRSRFAEQGTVVVRKIAAGYRQGCRTANRCAIECDSVARLFDGHPVVRPSAGSYTSSGSRPTSAEFSLLNSSRCHTSSDSNVQMRGCSLRSPDEWSSSSLATIALSNVLSTNEDGPVSKSNAISRKPPRNH